MIALIERATLAGALKTVTAALAKGNQRNLPILAGVRIDRAGDELTLTCTNIDLTIIATVTCEPSLSGKDGTVVIPADYLNRIVGAMNGEHVTLTEGKDGKVSVTCGDTAADLVTFEPEQWPKHLGVDGETVELDKSAVAILGHVVGFASTEDSHGTHCGVSFGPLGIRATDRYRAIVYTLDGLPEVTVPVSTVAAILRATDGPVAMARNERTVAFTAGNVTWISTVLAGEYLDFQRLMRDASPSALTFGVGVLGEALARVGTLNAEKVVIDFDDGVKVATLSAMTAEVGEISDNVAARGDYTTPVQFVNAHLVAALAVLDSDEITMEIVDSMNPGIIHAGPVTMLVMPTRVT